MLFPHLQFRDLCDDIASRISSSEGIAGRRDVTVIVEDKGSIENIVANALSVTGICVIIGVTGFSRGSQMGPLIQGRATIEIRIIEQPSVNRTVQGAITTQEMAERIIKELHWLALDELDGRPLLFQDFQRDDNDQFNIARLNFQGECSLGMVN